MLHSFASHCLTGLVLSHAAIEPPNAPFETPAVQVAPAANEAPKAPPRVAAKLPIARAPSDGYAGKPKTKPAKKKADPATQMVDKIQSFYEKTDDLTAEFIQLYTRKALSKTYESAGRSSSRSRA